MSYSAWSVIAGEQPTTSKWNLLGSNDSSFNDGTGIGAGAIGTAALAAGAVTPNKLNTGILDNYVATSQKALSTGSYGDLTTVGPSVAVNIGTNGLALVFLYSGIIGNTGGYAGMGTVLSGANTVAASDDKAIFNTFSGNQRYSGVFLYTGLAAGSTTFKAVYKAGDTTVSAYADRRIVVLPL